MPRKEYSFEIRDRAEDLYVEQGYTYKEVVKAVNSEFDIKLALNTVKKWGDEGDWPDLKKKHRENRRTLKRSLDDLRDKMLTKALGTLDPQDIYPLVALEKLLGIRLKPGGAPGEEDAADKKMTPEELLKYIRENVYGLR